MKKNIVIGIIALSAVVLILYYCPLCGSVLAGIAALAAIIKFVAPYFHERNANEQELKGEIMNDKENLLKVMETLYYANNGINNTESSERRILKGNELLVEAGHSLDELIYNLHQAEVRGMQNTFANLKQFTIIFVKQMEMSFNMFAACTPWLEAFRHAVDDMERYAEHSPERSARYINELQESLSRHQKILVGAYYIAKGKDNLMPSRIRYVLFENTSNLVQSYMVRLLKTYELGGDGAVARLKIIEEIGGIQFIPLD